MTEIQIVQISKSFGKMSALGKQAEKKYQEFFDAHNPKGWILHDVSGIRAYQNIDVDFVCQKNKDIPFEFERVFTDGGKNFVMIEVKYDGSAERTGRPTGNLPFEIYNKGEREIPSSEIGEIVMKYMKDLDQVAYVRFASVYREFKDAETFMDELKKLLK